MKKQSFFTKVLALSLALMMLFGALPVSAADVVDPTVDSSVATEAPTSEPTVEPTAEPATEPSEEPTPAPTEAPTDAPTETPTEIKDEENIDVLKYEFYADGAVYEIWDNADRDVAINHVFRHVDKIVVKVPYDSRRLGVEPKALFSDKSNSVGWWNTDANIASRKYACELINDSYYKITLDLSDYKADGVRYLRVDYGISRMDLSYRVTKGLTFDNTAPTFDCSTSTEAGKWYTKVGVTVGNISDNYSAECSVAVSGPQKVDIVNDSVSQKSFSVTKPGTYDVTVSDALGNSATKSVVIDMIDNNAPVIESVEVKNADTWFNAEEQFATIEVKATDAIGESGVDTNNFNITYKEENGEVKKAEYELRKGSIDQTTGAVTCTLDIIGAINTTYSISVPDLSGSKSNELEFEVKNYDNTAPSAEDFVVEIASAESGADKVLSLLSFGLYTNTKLDVTVTVTPNQEKADNKAPISDIKLYNVGEGDVEAIIRSTELVANGDNTAFSKTFKLDAEKIYNLKVEAVDAAGNKNADLLALTDIESLYVDDHDVKHKLDGEFEEVVYSTAKPKVDMSNAVFVGDNADNGGVTYIKGEGQVDITCVIEDTTSGLKFNADNPSEGINAYFGKVEDFESDGNGGYLPNADKILPHHKESTADSVFTGITNSERVDSLIAKVTAEYSVNVDKNATYLLLVTATNNCGNTEVTYRKFAVDTDAPEATVVQLGADYAKEQKVTFTVNDKPASANSGVATVEVKGADGDTPEVVKVEDKENEYYFIASKTNQTYDIKVVDELGNEKTITTEEIKVDVNAPVVSNIRYSNAVDGVQKWTAEDVTVTFDVTDPLAGVKTVTVDGVSKVNTKVEGDKTVCSFTANAQQSYTIHVEDNAGNKKDDYKTEVVLFENAAPSLVRVDFSTGYAFDDHWFSSETVIVTIYAKSGNLNEDNSGINAIELFNRSDNNAAIEPVTDMEYNEETQQYSQKFSLVTASKAYQFIVKATSGTGVSTVSNNLENCEVTLADEVKTINHELFDYVVSSAEPQITITPEYTNVVDTPKADEEYKVYNGDGIYTAVIGNEVAGIDISTVELYFGPYSEIKKSGENTKPPVTYKISPADYTINTPDNSNKVYEIVYDTNKYNEELTTGIYALYVYAESFNGKKAHAINREFVDNSAPTVDLVSYSNADSLDTAQTWSKDKVVVTYQYNDNPVDNGFGGIESIEVKGSVSGDYSPAEFDAEKGILTFEADLCQSYTITVKDVFGYEDTVTTAPILFDDEAPVVDKINYTNDHNSIFRPVVNVEFKIKNVSDKGAEQVSDVLYDKISVYGADGVECSVQVKGNTPENQTYIFEATKNQKYTIIAEDEAGNMTTFNTDTVLVDSKSPEIVDGGVILSVIEDNSILAKIYKFLTFGAYDNSSAAITVRAKDVMDDANGASGVVDITVTNNGKKLATMNTDFSATSDEIDSAEEFIASFVLDNESTYVADQLVITVTDDAGNEYVKNFYELYQEGKISLPEEDMSLNEDFEIVLTTASAEEEIGVVFNQEVDYNDQKIYSGATKDAEVEYDNDGTFTATITDGLAGVDVASVIAYFDVATNFDINGTDYVPNANTAQVASNKLVVTTYNDKEEVIDNGKIAKAVVAYDTDKNLDSQQYVFYVKALNNAGNEISSYYTVLVDNYTPTLELVSYSNADTLESSQTWAKEPVTVTYKYSDLPASGITGGIEKIEIKGSVSGDYSPSEFDPEQGELTFAADLCQQYTITVTDAFGHSVSTTTSDILFDDEVPFIKDITYANNNNSTWKNDKVKVSFRIDDNTNKGAVAYSGVELEDIKVLGNINNVSYDVTFEGTDENGISTYSFEADLYQTYTISATDIADNKTDDSKAENQTEAVLVDTQDPYVDTIYFVNDSTVAEKILNFLTFGIYSNNKVVMNVNTKDDAASSDINMITVSVNGKVENFDVDNTVLDKEGKATDASYTFQLPSDTVLSSDDIEITVSDVSGRVVTKTLSQLDDKIVTGGDKIDWETAFELAYTQDNKKLSVDIDLEARENNVAYQQEDGLVWYANENIDATFTVVDDFSKINSVIVELNGVNVTDSCNFNFNGSATDDQTGILTDFASHTGTKCSEAVVNLDLADVKDFLKIASKSGDNNIIKVTGLSNNGMSNFATAEFACVDNVAPIVSDIRFTGTNGVESDIVLSDKNTELPSSVVEKPYGYYFQNSTNVTVTATDFINGDGVVVAGSGVKSIALYGVDVDTNETVQFASNGAMTIDKNSTATAAFVIEAGFKGTIYAYVIDNVDNRSNIYTPDNTVVENEDIHNATSSSEITVRDTNYVCEDNNGNKLFNGDVTVDLKISDTYSGLNDVYYTISAPHLGEQRFDVMVDGVLVDSTWSAQNDVIGDYTTNIIKEIETTITLNNSYNYNDLRIDIYGTDNAGFGIENSSELFSIDTVEPKIEITYNEVQGNPASNGRTYYKDTRVATITVKERNFDPAGFDWSGIVNAEGGVPTFVSGDNWSTVYSDYTDESVHVATVAFATDGVYTVNVGCTDMAGNSSKAEGGEFTIDTIDPVISVTYDNNNASNGAYFASGRTATVTIVEHNFSAEDMYLTYTPTATMPDNTTGKTAPQLSSWSSSGDTHTATITFAEDGKYEFTIDYKDMALREAEQFKQDTFYVDTVIDDLKFNNVVNGKPYDGVIVPQIVFVDNNYSTATYSLTRISYDFEKGTSGQSIIHELVTNESVTTTGKTVTYNNFPEEELYDGIYLLSATITDLAGNTKTEQIMFSVNRFGSTFMLGDEPTEKLVDNVYTNDAPSISIVEINVNPVKEQSVSLSRNTKTDDLVNGEHYKITSSGSNNTWYKYIYSIDKSNFVEEGNYTLTVTSVDEFNKTVSNRTAQTEQENKTRERNCPVSFVVDKTSPVISIEGVENEANYKEASKDVKIMCLDNNIDKESLVVKLDGRELAPEEYTVDDTLIGEITVDLTVSSDAGESEHSVEVAVEDLADNSSTDGVSEFKINATWLTLYLSSPAAIIATVAVLVAAAIIIILIVRKKRKEEEE